ncbi:MAG: HIT-like protein [Candidatus Moranbacteria bacterium GW2011_GWC2_37_73]|nr:MAG: HIT family protein [Parcubacteria group bacterium GW2011_GWC1_36_108]KKQ00371.1 MAG: HIT-like protein [Candidatus Moranbacteria bacterium GW2011_GWD1_36_198]KKQ01107.1 MAG: HIT-like protein [Candidatus Moranbacteria bacterium GW2011_GWD2_36_198]KKQ39538.1 MAG: HIT-like protein [Candidatus Moranbacteria bacterium GW2011_GWC2_37_73]HAR99515.1 histidine triad nucleotide-binding protein [Candidatus Moranbacteria bacterium]
MNSDCIFCKIVEKKVDAKIVFENKEIIAFKDIHPLAPVHILIIPKKHIASINEVNDPADVELLGKMIVTARDIAKELNIAEDGYKLLFRTGKHGGQEMDHIHLHLIGGAPLHEEIRPLEVDWK